MAEKEKKDTAPTDEKKSDQTKQKASSQASQHAEKAKTTNKKEKTSSKEDQQQLKKLEQQVADLKKQVSDKDDQYLRAEAEIQNMNRHFKDERASLLKYEGQSLIKEILPVLDNLQRALNVKAEGDQAKQLHDGIEMVYKHFDHALKNHGVKKIEAAGKPFDPNLQQAVQTVPADDDHKADTVVRVLQDGYQLKDRVLRPAMVVVAQ